MIHFKKMFSFNDIDCILPGKLYLGNELGADCLESLQEHSITHVVQIRSPFLYYSSIVPFPDNFKYLQLNFADNDKTEIQQYFSETFEFISSALENSGIVYVHCAMGVSRSSSIVIAFLMKYMKLDFNNALSIVERCRPIVQPNQGFIKQLQEYENKLKEQSL